MRDDYKVILADPPWNWKAWSAKGESRSAKQHYDVMTGNELRDLGYQKILDWVDEEHGCILFLWAIDSMLPQALELIKYWGFKYKTVAFTWVKLNKNGYTPSMGMGYWTRANPEMCLLATRGKPKRKDKGVRQLIIGKRREHSRKPDEQYERIERLVEGPYLEMFARPPHQRGWDVWGNEAESD
jgi:N6-adenosine-specific RNA methylase IME4